MLTLWHRVTSQPFFNLRLSFKGMMLGVVVLSLLFGINQLNFAKVFPVQTVKVYGLTHLTPNSVQTVLAPMVTHGFFSVNVDAIKDRLMTLPWVSGVVVRRVWPNALAIAITEKKPVAAWNNESILSEGGELFTPDEDANPTPLVNFTGPEGGQVLMLNYFYQINRTLAPLHATILTLTLTPYMTWKLALDNGIALQIGHKDILTRLSQFVKVYPKIIGSRATDVDYVDLRYPNGMAVRWKTPVKT